MGEAADEQGSEERVVNHERDVSGHLHDGPPVTYRIRVRGLLPEQWSEWFDGFAISYEAGEDTTLTGPVVDQAALHGLLARVRDLGLTLLTVERIDLAADKKWGQE
jgi:hypothetical protein